MRAGYLPLYFDPAAYSASLRRLRELGLHRLCLSHPYGWSGGVAGTSPFREGPEVMQTLDDSEAFAEMVGTAAARVASQGSGSLRDQVALVLAELVEPFRIPIGSDCRFPASSAATILGYLAQESSTTVA